MSRQQNELPALFMDQSFKKNALNLSFFFEKYETEKNLSHTISQSSTQL